MKMIGKVLTLLCPYTFAAKATTDATVIFNGCYTTPNEYFKFEAGWGNNVINRVSVKDKITDKGEIEEVTLIIPSEFTYNGEKAQTLIQGRAFKRLYNRTRPNLKVKLIFQSKNGTYVNFPEDCARMFCDSGSIVAIDFSGINPKAQIYTTRMMFWLCNRLKNINFTNFNTSNVTNMESMFHYCCELEKLDLSNFNTKKVTNMLMLFGECNKLKDLNISSFNTRNVTTMQSMFNGCRSLKSLDLSHFDTRNVEEMAWMFDKCTSLTSLKLDKFKTEKVSDMCYMFRQCHNLQELDLSSFNMKNTKYYGDMLEDCENLVYADLPTNASAEQDAYIKGTALQAVCSQLQKHDTDLGEVI